MKKKTSPFSATAAGTIDNDTTIFWFRRDLRLSDNAGLYHALRDNKHVVPVFIFDTVILERLEEPEDRRIEFIYQTLTGLKKELEELGTSLVILYGNPVTLYQSLHPRAVYTNHDYEPYARARDGAIHALLEKKDIPFYTYKDQVIFDKDEVVKDDGKPYTVFTPYSRKWKAMLTPFYLKRYPVEKYTGNFKKIKPQPFPALEVLGFRSTGASFPERVIRTAIIEKYDRQRDFPAIQGTTRLSVHLRFGTVSIRKLCQVAQQKNQVWLNELIWREFYAMILWHFPQVRTQSFKPKYDRIAWRNDPVEFERWCTGQTGYPIVDAGMRELNTTGFMHNRVRMITASFLTKHLLIDWRWGEAYFGRKLLDYDLASNNGGWQWAAGSGCDAAPYFRVFNPELQTKKFDPDHAYIKKWVPEYQTDAYARPVVEHALARQRALNTYKKGLGSAS
ncbi:cryptochrome/photolyase family protein [Parachryseolinea silvisoli]|uniref:cryptochrome/photolyase family protein n=1 Tax=Parachryseolinea silvisoli TaxID=2873601 RepID=UPI002265B520|nr:deoxyribodipyrimidine photo-lyase [Parachryseolinea silvisoli]